jgi:hypothetical protein
MPLGAGLGLKRVPALAIDSACALRRDALRTGRMTVERPSATSTGNFNPENTTWAPR